MTPVASESGSRGLTIRDRLLLLVLAVVLPYLAFAALSLYDDYRDAVNGAIEQGERRAQRVAERLEQHVAAILALLPAVEIAIADDLRAEARNDERLRRLLGSVGLGETVARIVVFSRRGNVIAATFEDPKLRASTNVADREHFRQVLATRAAAIGQPVQSRVTGEWILPIAGPVLDASGEVIAVTVFAAPLSALEASLRHSGGDPNSMVAVVTDRGIGLARIPDSTGWWGVDVSGLPQYRVARAGGTVRGEVASREGVRQYGASVPVANAPWQVFAGTPVNAAMAGMRARFYERMAVAALMLLVAAGAAWWIGRGLARPILRLREGVRGLAGTDLRLRVPADEGGEVGELGAEINAMAAHLERSQRELKESEARFRNLADLSSDWYWEIDPQNRLVAVEGDVGQLFGVSGEQALGRTLRDFGYRSQGGERHRQAIAERRPFRDVEYAHLDARGEVDRVMLVSGEPRFGPGGEYLGYRGVARDATERMRLEAAVRHAQARLRLVVDAVPGMIAYADREKRFVFVNGTYTSITGRTPKETVGRPVREVLGERVFAVIEPYMDRALAGEAVEFERRQELAGGGRRDLRIQYVPDRNGSGAVQGIVALVSDVTELKEAQRSLAESEARYRELAELSSDWYWETDEQYRFSHISPGVEHNLDVSIEGLIGKARWEIDYLNMGPAEWAAHRAVLEARQPFRDLRLTRRNRAGRVTYQSITGRPRFDAAGRFLGYRGVGRDVTAQTEAEKLLAAERDRLSRVIETMAEGLAMLDAQGRYMRVNAAAERILGAPRESIVGRHYLDVPWKRISLTGSSAGLPSDAFERLRAGEKRLGPAIYALQRTDGEQRIVSHSAARIEDEKGAFAGVVATFEDITERMRAEGRLQLFLASALDGYWMTDMEGRILEVNHAMCSLLGYEERELLGTSAFDFVAGESADEMRARFASVRQKGHLRAEVQRRRKDGSIVHLEGAASYLPLEGGRVFAFFTDITERKRAERELAAREREITELNADLERRVEERTAELTAAYREMESFSYSVSHDLRAPLRAISGFSHILMEDFRGEVPPEAIRLLARVAQNAERMGALIDGLLEFGRLSRQPLRKQRLEPAELVREVLEELAPEQQGRAVDVRIGDLPPCWADRLLLKQVFANLLGNALKYTAARKRARIEVGSIVMGLGPVYYVRDNGAGFDMAYASKLFGMFQRLHLPTEFEGNGVGLALVRRIVERHDGSVWADAAPEKGATFFFRLGAEPAAGRNGASRAAA